MSVRNDPLQVSVVVAAFTGEHALARCLDSLAPQWRPDAGEVEVVAAAALQAAAVGRLRQRFPHVHFLDAKQDAEVFGLRSLGVRHARGRLIVLTEDHVTVSPGWLAALVAAHREGHAIAGGPVDNGKVERAYDWALYFCEYGLFMPPLAAGPTDQLSGINVAYDRELLRSCRPVWEAELRENEVHDMLRAAGHPLWMVPDAEVASHLEMSFGEAARHLFAGGRHFGRYRLERSSAGLRRLWWLAAPAVPGVLAGRIAGRVAGRRPRRLLHLVRGLPAFLGLILAWAAGETAGYLDRGEPAAAREV